MARWLSGDFRQYICFWQRRNVFVTDSLVCAVTETQVSLITCVHRLGLACCSTQTTATVTHDLDKLWRRQDKEVYFYTNHNRAKVITNIMVGSVSNWWDRWFISKYDWYGINEADIFLAKLYFYWNERNMAAAKPEPQPRLTYCQVDKPHWN